MNQERTNLFRVKICGVTCQDDARAISDAGADAIGLNFYERSPRCVQPRQAWDTVAGLLPAIVKVGVFVNVAPQDILQRVDQLGLDMIQLHGDEPPEFLVPLRNIPVIRAFRCRGDRLDFVVEYLRQCRKQERMPAAVLLDAYQGDSYGGTGKKIDWRWLAENRYTLGDVALVLAGGLTAENVAEAIEVVRPDAVDTASGVESSPGKKCEERVRRFVAAAKAAYRRLGP